MSSLQMSSPTVVHGWFMRCGLSTAAQLWIRILMVAGVVCLPRSVAAQVEAVAGQPFGVARISLPLPPEDVGLATAPSVYSASAADGRALYPAFSQGFLRRLFGDGGPPPDRLTVSFLFRGSRPFDVTVRTPTPQIVRVNPRTVASRVQSRILRRWWLDYNAMFREQMRSEDHPPIVATYLTAMLARRLNLPAPFVSRWTSGEDVSETRHSLEIIAGLERRRIDRLREVVGGSGSGPAVGPDADTLLPIPDGPRWRAPQAEPANDTVEIEAIAGHVPEECLYVRFGSFSNYLWLDDLLRQYGGDLSNLITARGFRPNLSERIQNQLAVKQSALAKILGPQVISDMALIGRDTFMREGAAVGILFEARIPVLGVDLSRQRADALQREKERGATEERIQIAGHPVSFVSTPDNRLRSFYAVDGNYHLVTTSRAIVERFYAAGQGDRPLGASPQFRAIRATVPGDRGDTLFTFLSSAFFQGLLSPQYQIELSRRLTAVTEMEAIKMARWAARTEGIVAESPDHLIAAQLLPVGFGQRCDGSGPIIAGDQMIDSLRGAEGSFLPVPDVRLRGASRLEVERYEAQAAEFTQQWRRMDPIYVAVRREPVEGVDGRERIRINASVAPLDETKYGRWMSVLGEPTTRRLVFPESNIVSLEASLRGGLLLPQVPAHTMFLGILDHVPLTEPDPTSLLKLISIVRTTPGYLGAWPKPGFLDSLPFGLGGQADAYGFSQMLFGVWRWQGKGFSMLSSDKSILAHAAQTVSIEDGAPPAQVRIAIGDLSRARFARWIDAMEYERARQSSVGNVHFINLLEQQLRVPQSDSQRVARDLLNADLVCPLGGTYQLIQRGDSRVWHSNAWPDGLRYELAADYHATVLRWFRGLRARMTKTEDSLHFQAVVEMQRVAPDGQESPSVTVKPGGLDTPAPRN